MICMSSVTGKCYLKNQEITQEEYDRIRAMIAEKPAAPKGFGYRLTDGLEWELYELPTVEETDVEISDSEALDIILGGADA